MCYILHNFCYVNADYWEENVKENADEVGIDINQYVENNNRAHQKRSIISQNLQ